jgi:hypothetical protein
MERGRENKYANETNIAEVTKNQIWFWAAGSQNKKKKRK